MTTVELNNPITVEGILVSELTLRRPKVRDRLAVERMSNNDAEKEVALIANLASISREAVEELDLADYSKIQGVLQDFLSQQKT